MQIDICDINGTPTVKYSAKSNKYSGYDTSVKSNWRYYDTSEEHHKEEKLFGSKSEEIKIRNTYYRYLVKLVLWEDHQ